MIYILSVMPGYATKRIAQWMMSCFSLRRRHN